MRQSHAQERAQERYNKILSDLDIHNICKIIQNNQHTFINHTEKDKNKKFCYLTYNHIPYKILYKINKKKCKIITIYPFDVDEYNKLQDLKFKDKINKAITFLEKNGFKVIKQD